MAHPECDEVQDIADVITSTGGIIKYGAKSTAKKFIIAGESFKCVAKIVLLLLS